MDERQMTARMFDERLHGASGALAAGLEAMFGEEAEAGICFDGAAQKWYARRSCSWEGAPDDID